MITGLRALGAMAGATGLIGAVGVISSAPGATGFDVIGGLVAFGLVWWLAAAVDQDGDAI